MKRIFPPMYDRPERWMPAAMLGYWAFAFVGIPLFMPLIGDGLWNDLQFSSWLEFVYHTINALVVVGMLRGYFGDSFINVRVEKKNFYIAVGIALGLMLILALWQYLFLIPMMLAMGFRFIPVAVDVFPINEMFIAVTSGLMVEQLPVFGTLCHTLFTPVAVVGLFYVAGFAPMCCRRTWLGYLVVTLLLALPIGFDILWRGEELFLIAVYIMRLPIHLIACWSYQKADSVWAPLVTLSIFNLITSLICLLPQ